jgi:hypothetical protein
MKDERGRGASSLILLPSSLLKAGAAGRYTDHVPPKPTVTLPASTITGMSRSLWVNVSIRLSSSGSFKTLM